MYFINSYINIYIYTVCTVYKYTLYVQYGVHKPTYIIHSNERTELGEGIWTFTPKTIVFKSLSWRQQASLFLAWHARFLDFKS